MRTYEIMLLHFEAPVHFGNAAEGGGLTEVLSFCRADTFFSALCQEAAMTDSRLLQKLTEKAERGDILISNLFPWHYTEGPGAGERGYELYLPRPVTAPSGTKTEGPRSFQDACVQSSERKARKKRAWIRASKMHDFLEECRKGGVSKDQKDNENKENEKITGEPSFGEIREDVHFNGRTRQPYFSGSYYFSPKSGLYLILSLADESDDALLMKLIQSAGLSGIGGRRSSGCGSFTAEEPVILEGDKIYGEDDCALYRLLKDDRSPCQMALCPVLPEPSEAETAAGGTGRLIRRGGFSLDEQQGSPVKTGTIYMMDAGSCFSVRLSGRIADVSGGTLAHPVLKYGKGLYIGIS